MTLTGEVKASAQVVLTAANDMGTPTHAFTQAFDLDFTDGTGANQANNVFSDERTLAASATENLDLSGSLKNAFGDTLAFTAIKAILIIAAEGNTNDVVVGGAATNAFVGPFGAATHTLKIGPGDCLLFTNRSAAGWSVTAGTGDLVKLANGGAGSAVTYRVVIIGEA